MCVHMLCVHVMCVHMLCATCDVSKEICMLDVSRHIHTYIQVNEYGCHATSDLFSLAAD